MMPLQPSLPKSVQEAQDFLISLDPAARIPVGPATFDALYISSPELVNMHLVRVEEDSKSVRELSVLVEKDPTEPDTEMDVCFTTAHYLKSVFAMLDLHSSLQVMPRTRLNGTEHEMTSGAVGDLLRPDTVVIVDNCTLILGESKLTDTTAAVADLASKRIPISPMHYGHVKFLLGFAAAGRLYQWLWLPGAADEASLVLLLSPVLFFSLP